MKTQYFTKGSVKKIATQGSKGGSMIITLEVPLVEENGDLALKQNKDCAVDLRFDTESIEKAAGQYSLDFDGDNRGQGIEEPSEEY